MDFFLRAGDDCREEAIIVALPGWLCPLDSIAEKATKGYIEDDAFRTQYREPENVLHRIHVQ